MACKTKFNTPLLDKPVTGLMSYNEATYDLLIQRLDALFIHFANEKLPDNLPMSVIKVIFGLAELAKIPGLMSYPDTVGQPSRWNGEDGFKLGAKVQIILLEQPKLSKRKAIISTGRKLFSDLSEDGIYRRYNEQLKQPNSYISATRDKITKLKQSTKYDSMNKTQQETLIAYFKYKLNKMHKRFFPESIDDLFVIKNPEQYKKLSFTEYSTQVIEDLSGNYAERIDPQSIFPVS